jgi:hypothetical protein
LLAALLRWRGDCVGDDALLSGRPRRRDGSHTRYRKPGDDLVPIMHAKLALLGHLQWQTEDALGNPDDIIWFTIHSPPRLAKSKVRRRPQHGTIPAVGHS